MLINLEICKDTAAHEKEWGRFNDFPVGWHQISEEDFAKSHFFVYSPRLMEYRQMLRHPDGTESRTVVAARLFFMHDNTGYGISSDYWGGKVLYFKFGCKHEFGDVRPELAKRKIRLGNCEHAQYCPKCGYFQIIDTSD